MANEKTFFLRLSAIQQELKVPKDKYNTHGNYHYRSAEQILTSVKPLLKKCGMLLKMSDGLENIGNFNYVKTTVTLIDAATGESTDTVAYSREDNDAKGKDASKITGSTSSYARKYALCGLFAIDDGNDADSIEYEEHPKTANNAPKPQNSVTHQPVQQSAPKVPQNASQGNGTTSMAELYDSLSIEDKQAWLDCKSYIESIDSFDELNQAVKNANGRPYYELARNYANEMFKKKPNLRKS